MKNDTIPSEPHIIDDSAFNGGYEPSECYKHMVGCALTPGVKYFADHAHAYWLLDVIASYQYKREVKNEEGLQTWRLIKRQDGRVFVELTHNKEVILEQHIPMTDFPFSECDDNEFSIWVTDQYTSPTTSRKLMILKSEY